MNKEQFINELRERLTNLPQVEIEKSVSFYDELIDDLQEEGQTEENAVASLGDIGKIVEEILLDMSLPVLVKKRVNDSRDARDSASANGESTADSSTVGASGADNSANGSGNANATEGGYSTGNANAKNKKMSDDTMLIAILVICAFPIWLPLLMVLVALYFTIWALMVSLYAVIISIAVGGLALIISSVAAFIEGFVGSGLVIIGIGLILVSISLFLIKPSVLLTKALCNGTAFLMRSIKSLFIKKEA